MPLIVGWIIDCEKFYDVVRDGILVPVSSSANVLVSLDPSASTHQPAGICSLPNPFMRSAPLEVFSKLKKLDSTSAFSVPPGFSCVWLEKSLNVNA